MIQIPNLPPMQGGVQHTALGAPEASAAAIAAPTEALGGIAAGIAAAGQHFHDIAVHAQKLDNARMESETRTALAQGYADFQASLQSDPDPASRIAKTREWTARAAEMIPAGAPPAVRESLTQHLTEFSGRVMIHATEDAARLAETRAKLAFKNELDNAQDPATAKAALDRAAATGIILPEQHAAGYRHIDQQFAFRAAADEITRDPIAAEQSLADPETYLKSHPMVSPSALDHLQTQASRAANKSRSDFANDMIISGTEPTEQELATMEEYGYITKSTHAQWLTRLRSGSSITSPSRSTGRRTVEQYGLDPAIHNEVLTSIYAYDPAADPDGFGLAALKWSINSAEISKEQTAVLNQKLTDRLKPEADPARKRSEFESDFHSRIETEFNRGDFGKFRFPTGETTAGGEPKFAVNQKEHDSAWDLRLQFEQEWKRQLEQFPDDTPARQITDAYETFKQKFSERKPPPDVGFSPVAPPPFDPQAIRQTIPGADPSAATSIPMQTHEAPPILEQGAELKPGATVSKSLLETQFPNRDDAWLDSNVRIVTTGPAGLSISLPRAGEPTDPSKPIAITPTAIKNLGGRIAFDEKGKPVGARGLAETLRFNVVSIETGIPLAGTSWRDAKAAWFTTNKPTSYAQIRYGLIALREQWQLENANRPPEPPPSQDPEVLPPIDETANAEY